jgi:biopolymer transport protein ExbD
MHWGKVMNLSSRRRDDPEINLTSLIDVVLLLLVFFMITTSFVRESSIGIRLPEAASSERMTEFELPMTVSVTAEGTYLVNGRLLIDARASTLESAIRKLTTDEDDKRITISADATASHQAVITVMDVAGKLGYVEVNISTVREAPE